MKLSAHLHDQSQGSHALKTIKRAMILSRQKWPSMQQKMLPKRTKGARKNSMNSHQQQPQNYIYCAAEIFLGIFQRKNANGLFQSPKLLPKSFSRPKRLLFCAFKWVFGMDNRLHKRVELCPINQKYTQKYALMQICIHPKPVHDYTRYKNDGKIQARHDTFLLPVANHN